MKTIGIENSKSSVQAHLTLGTKTMGLGIYGAYLALAIIYFWFGGMKFTHYEAEGLVPLVSNSPLLGWVYSIFSVDMFSSLLGIPDFDRHSDRRPHAVAQTIRGRRRSVCRPVLHNP